MELVFDIEGNGLLVDVPNNDNVKEATEIFCIVAIDENNQVYKFYGDALMEGMTLLQKADTLIGHNIIGYDIPLAKKILGIDLSDKKIIDTLVLSRLFKPTREGGHSLEKWGYRLGGPQKIEHEDWTQFSPEMLERCVVDVKITKTLFNALKKEALGFSKECISLEQETTRILTDQYQNGFLFDDQKAMSLTAELTQKLNETVEIVHKTFKPIETIQKIQKVYTKTGGISKMGLIYGGTKKVRLTDEEYDTLKNGAPVVERKLIEEFNLGSRQQIGDRLQEFGWKPQKFTPTGRPIVDESTLKEITHIPEAKLIADYLLYQKRLAQVHSWIDFVDSKDNRVHGSVLCTGAITGRMAHINPNMAQVPAVYSPFGNDCRSCWTVPEGYKLVGVDASGLELRMLAHYMADEEYVNEIINGDIHTTNQQFAGLESRDKAKTFIYALIYGAGDAKIGKIIEGSQREGKLLRERFLSSLPALRTLKERVDRAAEKGFLKGLDGRKILLRHKHAALNTLLQGGGAIVMKKALCILDKRLKTCNIDYKFVANIHDEWQIEVRECQANRVGQLAVQSIVDAGAYFDMRCPLDGEFRIGGNWSETH
jgi:DNA polymerase-1